MKISGMKAVATSLVLAGLGLGLVGGLAHAQDSEHAATVAMLGGGLEKPAPSQATDLQAYRVEAARHIYRNYPELVHPGKLPSPLHTVAIIETTIAADGAVERIEVVREPSAKAATPYILGMIEASQPYPAPAALGKVVYRDVWLIAQGRFQLEALTEGQERPARVQR
jgi:protein TonB